MQENFNNWKLIVDRKQNQVVDIAVNDCRLSAGIGHFAFETFEIPTDIAFNCDRIGRSYLPQDFTYEFSLNLSDLEIYLNENILLGFGHISIVNNDKPLKIWCSNIKANPKEYTKTIISKENGKPLTTKVNLEIKAYASIPKVYLFDEEMLLFNFKSSNHISVIEKIAKEEKQKAEEALCLANGYTDFFRHEGQLWAFPPNGVMPVPVKISK